MATKKFKFIDKDLEWCEKVLTEWQADVDANPFSQITDRWGQKMTSTGGVTHVIAATIEAQKDSIRKTMKDIAELLIVINNLREAEDAKQEVKGKTGVSIPAMMRKTEDE